jgi:hypothetical protein
MRNRLLPQSLLLLACLLSGCVTNRGNPLFGLQWPNLQRPGTLDQQRANAVLHDPYPDPYAGPPTESGRPREFSTPLAEPIRNKLMKDNLTVPR